MSNNLVKWCYTNVQKEAIRVIDVNTLMEKRIEELEEHPDKMVFGDGFVEGLQADQIDAPPIDEELSGNVIKAGEDAKNIMEQASGQAEEILARAQEEADAIRREAIIQAESECESLKAEAEKQGFEEGMEKARQEAEQMRREWETHKKELDTEYQKQLDRLEPEFVDTITGIYEHIFHVELNTYRDILVYLINDAMRKTEGSRNFLIHVSKEDYPYVSMQKKQIVSGVTSANISVEIVEDVTLDKNECMIETDGGILDCGVGTQLEELRQKLMLLAYGK